jgi:hypothetical protein
VSGPGSRRVMAVAAGWHAGSQQAALLGVTSDAAVYSGRSRLGDMGQSAWSWRDMTA